MSIELQSLTDIRNGWRELEYLYEDMVESNGYLFRDDEPADAEIYNCFDGLLYDYESDASDSLKFVCKYLVLKIMHREEWSDIKKSVFNLSPEIINNASLVPDGAKFDDFYYSEALEWCSLDVLCRLLTLCSTGDGKGRDYFSKSFAALFKWTHKECDRLEKPLEKRDFTPASSNPKPNTVNHQAEATDKNSNNFFKHVLSWIVLAVCYVVFVAVVILDVFLLSYISSLYVQLSAFLKILIIIFGGSLIFGLFLTPMFYGIPITIRASEAIYPSKKGERYVVLGALIVISSVINIIFRFRLQSLMTGIYGIALIIAGHNHEPE